MKNLVLADCNQSELYSLIQGLNDENIETECYSYISNEGRGKTFSNLVRYLKYFVAPISIFSKRNEYNYLIGWQQFYALIFAFWCQLFHVKKKNKLVALNYTYKSKKGLSGKIYAWFMKKCVCNEYIDYIHVLSDEYADYLSFEFGLPRSKFIVTPFGVDDQMEVYGDLERPKNAPAKGYALAIGRSNRDYDFLIKVWEKVDIDLVVISDEYFRNDLPKNVMLLNDISGEMQYPWIANCDFMIVPIDDPNVCSGDTVLLTAMSLEKTIFVTNPSTLAEMYVDDGENAIFISKDIEETRNTINNFIRQGMPKVIGQNARKTFLAKFSRYAMGRNIASYIK